VSGQVAAPDPPPCPPEQPPCPPNEEAANQDPEPVSRESADAACPPTKDVQERANLSTTERVAEKSLSVEVPVTSGEEPAGSANGRSYFEEAARLAQARRTVDAELGQIPEAERDFIADLVETFDARFVEDEDRGK
jgi:hypothetical protein